MLVVCSSSTRMKLLLVCAAILSTCWAAAVPETTTPVADPVSSYFNSTYPKFFTRMIGATDYRNKTERIFMLKDGKVTKILESGRCIAGSLPPTAITFFGSRHGIYRYNDTTEKIEKYGTLNDDIEKIIKESKSDDLYILTEDHGVYKVTEGGTKKTEIKEAKGAKDIELDLNANLFYIADDNQPFVVTSDGAKKIQGIPVIPSSAYLSTTLTAEDGVLYVFDKKSYRLHPDGTSQLVVLTEEEKAQYEKLFEEVTKFWDTVRNLEDKNYEMK